MGSGSKGARKCKICGSRFPHLPMGPDSCEWDTRLNKGKAMSTPAKIEPHVKLLAANIIQKLMPIEDGNEHVFYELCGIIADHAPRFADIFPSKSRARRSKNEKRERRHRLI